MRTRLWLVVIGFILSGGLLTAARGERSPARFGPVRIHAGPELAAPAGSAPSDDVTVHRDVKYASYQFQGSSHDLLLDLYLPPQTVQRPVPVLVFMHGGGWFEGSKSACPGTTLAENGYATACIQYRLGRLSNCPAEFIFPAQMHDVKAAVRWLRGHAGQYSLDPNHMGAIGYSSGGHLAALLGTSYGVQALQGTENLGVSDAVQAVVDWYGPVDPKQPPAPVFLDDPCTTTLDYLNNAYGGESTPYFYLTLAWGTFLGGSLSDPMVLERAVQASPATHADVSDPPFLIIHGEADGMIPWSQSQFLATALGNAGVSVTFVHPAGAGHVYGAPGQEISDTFLSPTLAFLSQYLGGTQPTPSPSSTTVASATPSPTATTVASTTPSPTPGGLSWVRVGGPPGGLGYDIRYNFADPNTWYVTDAFAGVHVSTDNGRTWHDSNTGIPGQKGATGDGVPIFSLTVDPHNAQIIWAGTQQSGHIYRSTDGGQTWQQRDTGVIIQHDLLSFRGFTVDPRSSDIVYAMGETNDDSLGGESIWSNGVGGVIYKTTNGGEKWEVIWDGGMPSSLARYMWIDPRDPNVLYVSTGIFDRGAAGQGDPATDPLGGLGILKSIDGGETWDVLGEANGLDMLYVGSLYMHPDNPDILLAAAGRVWGDRAPYVENLLIQGLGLPGGVFRTTDGGQHWTKVLQPLPERSSEALTSVEYCPSNPSIAYAGSDVAIYRSQDAGQTWVQVSSGQVGWGPRGVKTGWPIDMQCDPRDPNRIFANNYGGGNFLSEDGGRTWQNASRGYTGAAIRRVEVSPFYPARVYAGDWRSDNGGDDWSGLVYPPNNGTANSIGLDPDRPNHVLIGAGFGDILESTDGGFSWQERWALGDIIEELQGGVANKVVSSIAFAPSNPMTAYASFCHDYCCLLHEQPMCGLPGAGVVVSNDGGTSWQRTTDEDIKDTCVLDLAVSPDDASTVFAAASKGLFTSTDGGITWDDVAIAGVPDGSTIRAVAVCPTNAQRVLAAVEKLGVYVSADGGASWQAGYAGLEPNGSLHDIEFDPMDPDLVYVSDHSSGVYRSVDGGRSWLKINEGLDNRAAMGLSATADGQHLYVGTDAEGVFRLDLNGRPPETVGGLYLPLVVRQRRP